MVLPVEDIAELLAVHVKSDASHPNMNMSASTSELLGMLKQSSPEAWAQQLPSQAASLLAKLFNAQGKWHETVSIFESQSPTEVSCWH